MEDFDCKMFYSLSLLRYVLLMLCCFCLFFFFRYNAVCYMAQHNDILVLIASVSNEGSDEPTRLPGSLPRAFPAQCTKYGCS